MVNRVCVLIVEDEIGISDFIKLNLKIQDYKVLCATTGKEALQRLNSECIDIVLLDLGLPDMDGVEVLQKLREWSAIPVIVVSAREDETEKVKALDSGADDYITKPFGTIELLARIRTAYRHSAQIRNNDSKEKTVYRSGDLEIDLTKRVVKVKGQHIHLTQIEYRLIALLVQNAGRVMTYDAIINHIWGPLAVRENQILRVNMANIRRKIEENLGEPKYIFTEVGVGYRMAEETTR